MTALRVPTRRRYNAAPMPRITPNFKTMLDRPARLRGLALLALLLLVLAILGGMIWRNLQRLDTIQAYVSYSHQIQQAGLEVQQVLLDSLSGSGGISKSRLAQLTAKIREITVKDAHLAKDTPAQLRQVGASLARTEVAPPENGKSELFNALRIMRQILDAETDQREIVLEEISRGTLVELEVATGTLTLLLLLGWMFLRGRILAPLHDLKQLLLNLAKEEYTPIDTRHLDPLLLPVFNSYNVMVTHLGELELAKREHAESLEAEVRTATQALLEQQGSLARAERLAAVGELAACLAHELRNPLAGIQMSCANLRNEVDNPDQAERLDLIGAELKRMTRLLNDLLDQGRQAPAPAKELNLASLVRELVSLTRYQIPRHIALNGEVPGDLTCHLPECDLRQALLNLILNAAQALDESPGAILIRARRDENSIVIEVTDDGPGFSEEMLASGIRPFATGRPRGTGLGLAIVQRFAREAGGQIRLSNRLPHGACVTLILPCRES
jgi:two-component system NtrC family sensor kinase